MKLDERDSIIVDTLLECGMDNKIAKNPDAVEETLSIATRIVKDIDVTNKESKSALKDKLSKIISDDGSIVYSEESRKNHYITGLDGKETIDYTHTDKNTTKISVDENNITTIDKQETRIDGYGDRDPLNHPSRKETRNIKRPYPEGAIMGSESIYNTTIKMKAGVQIAYSNSSEQEQYYSIDQMRFFKDLPDPAGRPAGHYLKPNLENGEYWQNNGIKKDYESFEYGIKRGIPDRYETYKITGSTLNVERYPNSPDVVRYSVSQNRHTYADEYFIEEQSPIHLPDKVWTNPKLTEYFVPNLSQNTYQLSIDNFYALKKELDSKEGEQKFELLNELSKKAIENRRELKGKLAELAEINKGNKQPETVELEDLSKYKQTKQENLSQDESRTETSTDDFEWDFDDSSSSTGSRADETYKKSYDMVKKEPNILKRMLNFIKEKFRGKNQTKDAKNNNDLEL